MTIQAFAVEHLALFGEYVRPKSAQRFSRCDELSGLIRSSGRFVFQWCGA
ncbi:MAG: hypothetical protein IJP54_08545 [Synergistaceae bacterium]|nr:hypothetical protein [Synergistaceae bacterium]MBR0035713.1 hypothetical protein [Synergistaceae bacterium]